MHTTISIGKKRRICFFALLEIKPTQPYISTTVWAGESPNSPEIKGHTDHKSFLWQGLPMLREENPGQSSLYLYEPGSYAPRARVDEKEGEAENKVYYFHTDQIGTPLEITDAEAQIVWQAKYRAWGSVEKLVVNEVEQNLRFQGQYFDVETGLHYNTFRYYDPEIGKSVCC
ncbi:hypothetical protein ALQ15_200031 [Pseudomonas syringae pv. actinidiae]|uniref:RHS protein conserved region domain-containing protein n=1 Tax=Pseudomonas syringae pv. actinidiae TaxID=103796 RepID=A0A7Z6XV96_PSESF|nr:hypothetical protein ALQ15_200031 [Pseudomonas syringae pv. actinidiae]